MKMTGLFLALALASAFVLNGCGADQPANNAIAPTGNNSNSGNAPTEPARASAAMSDSAFRAEISVANPPTRLDPGQQAIITVKVKNVSDAVWPMRGRQGDGYFQVNLGDHWLDANNRAVRVDERTAMPRDLRPGEEVELPITLVAPNAPGNYVVTIEMVQEGVAWFSTKGPGPFRLNVRVGR